MNGFELKSFLYGLSAMAVSAAMVGAFSFVKRKCIDCLKRLNSRNEHTLDMR